MRSIFKGTENRITSPFGYRTINGVLGFHYGIDVVSKNGDTLIVSPVHGKVISSTIVLKQYDASGKIKDRTWEWGNYVRIDDDEGNRHFFCHMSLRKVKVGDIVSPDTIIGVMGNIPPEICTGAHCHYEIRVNQNGNYVSVDPEEFWRCKELQEKEMTVEEAKKIIQEKCKFTSTLTMTYLECYKYSNDLLIKLAKGMIK